MPRLWNASTYLCNRSESTRRIKYKHETSNAQSVYTLPKPGWPEVQKRISSACFGLDRVHGNAARTQNAKPANNTYREDNRVHTTEIRESHGDGSRLIMPVINNIIML